MSDCLHHRGEERLLSQLVRLSVWAAFFAGVCVGVVSIEMLLWSWPSAAWVFPAVVFPAGAMSLVFAYRMRRIVRRLRRDVK